MKTKWIAVGVLVPMVLVYYAWHYHWSCKPAARRISGLTLTGNIKVVTCKRDVFSEEIALALDSAAVGQAAAEAAQKKGFRRFEDLRSGQDSSRLPELLGRHGWLFEAVSPDNGGDRIILDIDGRTLQMWHGSR